MKELFTEILSTYLIPILASILTAIASYVGIQVKKLYEKKVNTETKKAIVSDVVKMVEQVYKDIHGKDKYNKAVKYITDALNEKNIPITDLEIKYLIESTCSEFVKEIKKEGK